MPVSPEVAHLRAVIANASMRGDLATVRDAKRDLAALLIEQHITRVALADASPFTDEQRARLVDVINGGAA